MTDYDDIPQELEAERALIGSALISPYNVLREARWIIHPGDFYKPSHQWLWDACVNLHVAGNPVDPVTVAAEVTERIPDALAVLWDMYNATPASSGWKHYVDLIIRASTARRLIHIAADASLSARTGSDPYELARTLKGDLDGLTRQSGALPDDLRSADDFAALGDEVMPPWIVPGWMRYGWRTVAVATEGLGKSVLTLQWATMVAQGVNPMWPSATHPRVSTLVIDLENPAGELRDRMRRMKTLLERKTEYIDDLCHIWHRPAGIDLRSSGTAREFEAVLQATRPALVVLSPLYKAFRRSSREDHEDVANDVTTILDDFRARYGFALIIEHHAPKGGQGFRDMVPFGSSIWQRWPEFGLSINKTDDGGKAAKVDRFRGDRIKTGAWPSRMAWGREWPWEFSYDEPSPWA